MKILHRLIAFALLTASGSAFAADNYAISNSAGTSYTIKSKECQTGIQCPQSIPTDVTGAPYGPANPQSFGIVGTVPLPAGAATAAKQPAIGTAGVPATDVLTVQGIAGGTPQPADTVIRATSTSRSIVVPVGGATAVVTAGGSGQAVGDILTFVGGTCTVQPRYNVSAVTSGAATAVTLNTAGSCTVLPASPVATTSSGAGTAATLTPTYASIATQLMAANASRRGFQVQPQGGTAYLSGIANATVDQNSLKLPADALYETLPQHTGTGVVSVISSGAVPLPVYAREF